VDEGLPSIWIVGSMINFRISHPIPLAFTVVVVGAYMDGNHVTVVLLGLSTHLVICSPYMGTLV